MAQFYPALNDKLKAFIAEQKLFFTATAPLEGRINLSPKGIDTFRCIDDQTVGYLDLTGSGNETAAHLIENGRMTIMFCSFTEKPLIMRLYGQGRVVRPRHPEWANLHPLFGDVAGQRQIVVMAIEAAQTSCGTGVPLYEYQQDRSELVDWAVKKGDDGIYDYWQKKNQTSIDGLPTYLLKD
ncbi:MAG TPA: pyridoxamine 5'-phosphate oxidase family protein [Chroococcidiopsis sp.]